MTDQKAAWHWLVFMPRAQQVLLCGALFFGALAFGGVATFAGLRQAAFERNGIVTMATVTSVENRSKSKGITYIPTFEFTDQNGATVAATTGSMSSSSWAYPKGTQVEVRYDPAKPHIARPTDFFSSWLIPIAFGGLSVVMLTIGATACIVSWKWGDRIAGKTAADRPG